MTAARSSFRQKEIDIQTLDLSVLILDAYFKLTLSVEAVITTRLELGFQLRTTFPAAAALGWESAVQCISLRCPQLAKYSLFGIEREFLIRGGEGS
jgi:hypothetical protein